MESQKAILKIESYSTKDGMLLLRASDHYVRTLLKWIIDLCQKNHGGYIKLEMSPPYRKRTLLQNARYWAKCTEFGKFCGMTKDEVSYGVKFRAMEEGLWRGKEVPFAKTVIMIPDSSATANTVEMNILDEVLNRIAAEYGYVFDD